MSVINNATNPFLLNIQPITNQPQYSSGLDPVAVLRSDVNDIQQMVIFSEKRIAVDVINAYNNTEIQVINNFNIASNNILSINEIPVVPGGTVINNYGCNGGSEYMGSNSYGWYFPPSSIGGVGIKDSTGIPRAPPDDTYTDAITKIDYYIFENFVDSAPAPKFLAESQSISSINYYWANPSQFKFNFVNQWAPYISSIQLNLYSNVRSNSSNLWLTYLLNGMYVPNGTIPLGGVEFMNSITPGSTYAYSNPAVSNYVLQVGIDPAYLTAANGPYNLVVNFQNYSIQPYKYLNFYSNNLATLIPRAPTTSDFNVTLYLDYNLGVYVIPTLHPDAYLTPTPVYYYTLLNTTDLTVTSPGPYNDGTYLGVSVISGHCGYGATFQFSVFASNSFGASGPTLVTAHTGPAPFAATPSVGLTGIFNSNTGAPTLTYSANNQDGTLYWIFTTAPGLSGTGVVNTSTTLTPSDYFQYYDTQFTFTASNVAFCKQTSTAITTYQSNYFVAAPQLYISITSSNPDNTAPYYISVFASNIPYLGSGVSLSNTWTNYNDTNVSQIVTTNSNLICIGSNVNVFTFGAQYTLKDNANSTRQSAASNITGNIGLVFHSFSLPIIYTQTIPVTFPANSFTCVASNTIGYVYTGLAAPGNTILFQNNPPNTNPGTVYWSYYDNTP